MIEDFPNQKFIAGGEESYGLMIGDEVRDKDAITASLLAYEMMSFYKQNNTSVFHQLIKLYIKYGFYKEKLISIVKEGQKGQKEINDIIDSYSFDEIVWAQEEPRNMGAYAHMLMHIVQAKHWRVASRRSYSAPAAGSATRSKKRHQEIIDFVFDQTKDNQRKKTKKK